VFVHDRQHPDLLAVVGLVLDEVVGPDVILVLRPQPDTRTVVEPQTPSFRLFARHLQTLLPPDPLDPLVVDPPSH
jgi:hypothetical protein